MGSNSLTSVVATGTLTYANGMWKWLENNAVEYSNENLEKLIEHVARDRYSAIMWRMRMLRTKFLDTVHPTEDKVDLRYETLHFSGPYTKGGTRYYSLEGVPKSLMQEGVCERSGDNPLAVLEDMFNRLSYVNLADDMYEALNTMQIGGILAEEYERESKVSYGKWPGGEEAHETKV